MGGHNTHGARLPLIKSPVVGSRPAGVPPPHDTENGKIEMSMFETPEFERVCTAKSEYAISLTKNSTKKLLVLRYD
jgi:hypothetical protein